jgi:septal ring factor EnvC (AmiA/AmiB activator)
MSLFAKIMVVVNLLLAVAFLAAAGTLLGAAEDYKAKYIGLDTQSKDQIAALNKQVDERESKLKEAANRFADSERQRVVAESNLKNLSGQNEQLAGANSQLRTDYDKLAAAQVDLQTKLSDLNKQIDTTRNELAASETARKAAEDKGKASADEIARLTQDKETAEKSLQAAETARTQVTKDLDESRVTLERYRKDKGNLPGGVAMKDVHGVVQAVDNRVDIYVISVGSKDGVQAGYEFTVYRGNEYVSTIVIDKVFPNYSSGTTKPGTKRRDVMAGDEAATRL